ncbi:hypothetical protein QFC19_001484 [Naganishia cerealis]|uniref:Uncharacterized protein n=1 Tax=Naganishia cerealis TaxID=610337 RepID=A0ACC2WHM0_9TREE|nr:hypothetical protein QFC19_001484 [Naganishia cerealis]
MPLSLPYGYDKVVDQPSSAANAFPDDPMSSDQPSEDFAAESTFSNVHRIEAIPEAASSDLSYVNASDSNFSIWPEDVLNTSTRGSSEDQMTMIGGGDEFSVTDGLARFALGDYHAVRLAPLHDRSDTSSPVSNSEEDDDERLRENLGLPVGHPTQSIRRVKRAAHESMSDEDTENDPDDIATFKEDWHTSTSGRTDEGELKSHSLIPDPQTAHAAEPIRIEENEPVAAMIPNEIIMHVSHFTKEIVQLSINGSVSLDSPLHLQVQIKLAECNKLTDRSIIALAHHCPLILEFDLQNLPGMTDKSMREIWMHSTYLREFRLTGNESITDAGFPSLTKLPGNGWNHATGVAQPEETAETSSVPRKIDTACREAPKVESFAYLRTVDLTGCTGITDEAIASIIAAAPKIRALTLAKCIHLTDASIESVAKLGKQLHYLHAAHLNQ